MKIGHTSDGFTLEPDKGPRDTRFHKKIVRVEKLDRPGFKSSWHHLFLECGHSVTTIGNLKHAAGVVLCTKCRDLEENECPNDK